MLRSKLRIETAADSDLVLIFGISLGDLTMGVTFGDTATIDVTTGSIRKNHVY